MPRTQHERLWIGGAAVLAVLLAAVGYFMLIGPQRHRTAAIRKDVGDTSFQETTLQSRITSLTAQSRRIATYRAALAKARQALPAADDVAATPDLLRSLSAAAAATSTAITSLTVGDPQPVTPTATAPAPASSSTTATPPVAAVPAAPTLSSIAVGATVTGSMAHLGQFLSTLQRTQPRALLISAVTLSPATSGHSATTGLKLTMTAFVRPAAAVASSPTPGG